MTSWPRSVLNGVNCKLHDAITELSKKVESVEASTQNAKDELQLYKSLHERIEREKESREAEKRIEHRKNEELQNKLKTYKEEIETLKKAVEQAELHYTKESQKLETIDKLLNEKLNYALNVEKETENLENVVKVMTTEQNYSHENVEKMERENVVLHNTSHILWEKSHRVSKELLVAKDKYKREVELNARIQLEEAQVQRNRQITQANYEDVIKQINALQEQIANSDRHIEANGKLIQVIKTDYHDGNLRKEYLRKKLNELRESVVAKAQLQQQKQINYNKHISDVRLELSALHERTTKLVSLEEEKLSVHLKNRSLQRALLSLSEQIKNYKANTLLRVQEYQKELCAIKEQMYNRNVNRYSSIREAESMKQLYICEINKKENETKQKERQLQRLIEQKTETIAIQECLGTKINTIKLNLQSAQHRQSLLSTEQLAVLKANQQLMEVLRVTESKINAKRVERELDYALMQKELKQQIYELREQNEQLSQMNATIKNYTLQSYSMFSHTVAKIRKCKQVREKLDEETIITAAELQELEKESAEVDKEQQRQERSIKTHETQLAALRLLTRNLSVKEAQFAGIEEEYRGNYQQLLVELSAQMHTLITALHLEEQALHEYKNEFIRNQRKCELLKLRYQEMIDTLSLKEEVYEHERNFRSSALAQYNNYSDAIYCNTSCKAANQSNIKSATDRFVEDNLVEKIHARHILTRSCEREELMQRGNFLDDRIVAMERETTTLKQMLHALGNKSLSTNLESNSVNVSEINNVVHHKQHSNEENRLINKEIKLQGELTIVFDAELTDVRKRLVSLRRKSAELLKALEVKKAQLQLKKGSKKARVLNVNSKISIKAPFRHNSKFT